MVQYSECTTVVQHWYQVQQVLPGMQTECKLKQEPFEHCLTCYILIQINAFIKLIYDELRACNSSVHAQNMKSHDVAHNFLRKSTSRPKIYCPR